MIDQLILDVATLLARVHAWRAPGEWVVAAFALGALVAGYLVPGAQRARQALREFAAWCAWRAEERKRVELEQEKALETEQVITLLTQRKADVRPARQVAAARPAPVRAAPAPDQTVSLDASDVVFVDPAGDDDQTRAWTADQMLAHESQGDQEAPRDSQVRSAVTRGAASSSRVRLPRAADLESGRNFVERRRGLA